MVSTKRFRATKLTVLTNNPKKLIGLEGHGLDLRISIEIEANQEENYLNTKKIGTLLNI